jgi:hypothetical protein
MNASIAERAELAAAGIPPFFESPVSALLIAIFLSGLIALTSLHTHRQWMRDSTLMAWVAVVIVGGPAGALAWFGWGRPAVRAYGASGAHGYDTDLPSS